MSIELDNNASLQKMIEHSARLVLQQSISSVKINCAGEDYTAAPMLKKIKKGIAIFVVKCRREVVHYQRFKTVKVSSCYEQSIFAQFEQNIFA